MDSDAPALRKIIHVDMDAFYASVEQRDNPELRGKPVAVGGSAPRGVVAAASYEARTFGVRSAMPGSRARRLCPDLIFVTPRFDAYRAVSQQIHAIFQRFTDIIQPLSLDEAYLDVTRNKPGIVSATYIAEEIRRMIYEETSLTASAGISYNKLLAKLASDQNKPNGQCVITPQQGADFISTIPVSRIHGIGPVTARRMRELNIETGADLRAHTLSFLQQHFGKAAHFYHAAARGMDDRPVDDQRIRKSISVEDTFEVDLYADDALMAALDDVVQRLWARMEKAQSFGRTVTLKIKFNDFAIITRSASQDSPVLSPDALRTAGQMLLMRQFPVPKGVRLLGLGVHNLAAEDKDQPAPAPKNDTVRQQLCLAL
ncbi:MAG: DNA polymerase IV [Sphingobium sp.]|nr:DNA polymerase IV [Sphingobium sp.]